MKIRFVFLAIFVITSVLGCKGKQHTFIEYNAEGDLYIGFSADYPYDTMTANVYMLPNDEKKWDGDMPWREYYHNREQIVELTKNCHDPLIYDAIIENEFRYMNEWIEREKSPLRVQLVTPIHKNTQNLEMPVEHFSNGKEDCSETSAPKNENAENNTQIVEPPPVVQEPEISNEPNLNFSIDIPETFQMYQNNDCASWDSIENDCTLREWVYETDIVRTLGITVKAVSSDSFDVIESYSSDLLGSSSSNYDDMSQREIMVSGFPALETYWLTSDWGGVCGKNIIVIRENVLWVINWAVILNYGSTETEDLNIVRDVCEENEQIFDSIFAGFELK